MNSLKTAVGSAAGLLLFGCATSHVAPIETRLRAEFVGSTPCNALARDFLKIPNNDGCECIRWQLRLRSSDVAGRGTYTLVTIHGISETNGHGFFQGGTKKETAGRWVRTIGQRANPHTTVYQLQATAPHRSLSLVKVDENLLHFLTYDGRLMVGNDSWSWTFNRTPEQP